jgi:hypothetical protein
MHEKSFVVDRNATPVFVFCLGLLSASAAAMHCLPPMCITHVVRMAQVDKNFVDTITLRNHLFD